MALLEVSPHSPSSGQHVESGSQESNDQYECEAGYIGEPTFVEGTTHTMRTSLLLSTLSITSVTAGSGALAAAPNRKDAIFMSEDANHHGEKPHVLCGKHRQWIVPRTEGHCQNSSRVFWNTPEKWRRRPRVPRYQAAVPPERRLRGGAAGAWRVVQTESRRERQAVRNVLLYYPNLIGYARLLLVLTSYYLAETNWKASSVCYLVGFAADAVDGRIARQLNQASRFGSVLDMVTDRSATVGLLLVLSRLYGRRHAFAFLLLMYIDLFSHWMHTESVLNQHHKTTGTLRRRNVIIRTYYDNLPLFAFCCIGAEFFYLGLYLLHFFPKEEPAFEVLRKACYFVCLPACLLKQLVNVAQLVSAARMLALEELESEAEA